MKQKEKDRQVSLHKICPDDIGIHEGKTDGRQKQTDRKKDRLRQIEQSNSQRQAAMQPGRQSSKQTGKEHDRQTETDRDRS